MDQNENRNDDLFDLGGSGSNDEPPKPVQEPIAVEPAVSGAQVYSTPPEPAPAYTPPYVPQAATPVKTGGSRVWLIVIIVAVVLCCCLLGFVLFMWFVGGDMLLDMMGASAPVLRAVV